MAGEMDEEIYKQHIPKNCMMQTLEEHMGIMLCWGLVASIRDGHEMKCGDCEMSITKGNQNGDNTRDKT